VTYYRFHNLAELGIPYTRATITAMATTGRFPRPVRLLNGRLRWDAAEIQAWLVGRTVGGV